MYNSSTIRIYVMNKLTSLLCFFILCFFSTLASAALLVLEDSNGNKYQLDGYLGDYGNNQQFSTTYISASGNTAQGLTFFDSTYNSFKIITFENEALYGLSIEGHWVGDRTPAFYMLNNGATPVAITLSVSNSK
jgi:hypothetical protein